MIFLLIWNGPRGKRMNYDFSMSVGTHGGRDLSKRSHRQTHRHLDTQTDKQADRLTNRHTDWQTDRQTDRQTDWQTGRQTDKQTYRLTNRQIGSQGDWLTNRQTGWQGDWRTDWLTLKVVKEIMGQDFWRQGKGGGEDCILSKVYWNSRLAIQWVGAKMSAVDVDVTEMLD
jgi:hypothetical protein